MDTEIIDEHTQNQTTEKKSELNNASRELNITSSPARPIKNLASKQISQSTPKRKSSAPNLHLSNESLRTQLQGQSGTRNVTNKEIFSSVAHLQEKPLFNEPLSTVKQLTGDNQFKEATRVLHKFLTNTESNLISQPERAQILVLLGNLHIYSESFIEAEKVLAEAREIMKDFLGLADCETAKTTNLLAICSWKSGKLQRAENLFREALGIFRMEFGEENEHVAKILCNLSIIKKELGNFEEAEQLLLQGLGIQKSILGPDSAEVALSLQDLGILFGSTGNMERAQSLFEESLKIQQTALGTNHPAVARTLSHLAITAEAREQFKTAGKLHHQALEILLQLPEGRQNSAVVNTLMNIAVVESKQELFSQATQHLLEAEEICKTLYPTSNMKAAEVQKLLGCLYVHGEEWTKAEDTLKHALTLFQQHENTFVEQIFVRVELADLFSKQDRQEEHQKQFGEALRMYKQHIVDKNNPLVVDLVYKLAEHFYERSKYTQARELYSELAVLSKTVFGENHPSYKHAVSMLDELDEIGSQLSPLERSPVKAVVSGSRANESDHSDNDSDDSVELDDAEKDEEGDEEDEEEEDDDDDDDDISSSLIIAEDFSDSDEEPDKDSDEELLTALNRYLDEFEPTDTPVDTKVEPPTVVENTTTTTTNHNQNHQNENRTPETTVIITEPPKQRVEQKVADAQTEKGDAGFGWSTVTVVGVAAVVAAGLSYFMFVKRGSRR